MASGSFLGISIYGLVVMAVTVVALFTRGWTKATIVLLIIAWIPFALFVIAVALLMASVRGLLGMFVGTLIICAPILLILAVFLVLWKLSQRFRD